MIKYIFIFLLLNLSVHAEELEKAYNYYKNNEYYRALNILLSYEKKSLINDELYYNIGNCYYRINKPGLAIYYYEKALLENKANKAASENIIFIRKNLSNQITPLPSFFAYYIVNTINLYLSIDFLSIIYLVLFILLLYFIFIILLNRKGNRLKYYKITTIFLSFALLVTILILLTSYYYNIVVNRGVIIKSTSVYSSPSDKSISKDIIGEGNKFISEDIVNNFIKVKFEDGSFGWIRIDDQKQLNNKL